ncbi:hypothetical protein [Peribacillus frigoritolerans]|uniref:hypothetical protein n=1 Tax=Peribacillus frigoritolerans TaxID=450367 RepID=UPI0020BE5648|nr:hypothetical protein [Peribacillus frigoritolerans]
MDTKRVLDKLMKEGNFPPEILKAEDETPGVENFKIYKYRLIVRSHYSDLWNLHKKKIKQSYTDTHKKYIEYRVETTNTYNSSFCPIYFITLSFGEPFDSSTELPFYVGKTNQDGNRFQDGHRATQKLLNPKFHNFEKHIYFAQVLVDFHYLGIDFNDIPIEWLKPEGFVNGIIRFLEYFFIFNESTRLGNEDGLDNEEIGIKYREWKEYWPQPLNDEPGITIEVDSSNGINAPYLDSIGQSIWSTSNSDRYKRKLFNELDKEREEAEAAEGEE